MSSAEPNACPRQGMILSGGSKVGSDETGLLIGPMTGIVSDPKNLCCKADRNTNIDYKIKYLYIHFRRLSASSFQFCRH